jgi:hypothetical protein
MKYVSSSRRQIVMAILLALAVVGGAMRHWATNPSLARDIGTLLLVLWLPAVGNLVAFGVRQWHLRARRRKEFDTARGFSPQLVVRITPLAAAGAISAPDPRRCTVAIGKEGFTARTEAPLPLLLGETGSPRELPLELLRPGLALPRLQAGTPFQLLAGNVAVADGTVLRHFP